MIPVLNKHLSVVLVLGVDEAGQKLQTEHLGSVVAFDPEAHLFATAGFSLEMARRVQNYYINEASGFYPAWVGFRRLRKPELLASYRQWLKESHVQRREAES